MTNKDSLYLNVQKMLHYVKFINMSKIIFFINLITLAESISLTDKVEETTSDAASHAASYAPSKKNEDSMVFFLSTLTAALETIDSLGYLHLDTKTMNTSQLIACHGYKAEEHTVISNGYILRVFRIPCDGPTVLLMHGLLNSSNEWLTLGDKSLAIMLAGFGYDVWLLNARGNTYSRKHTCLSPKDPKFWDFSWHEIGTEDLPVCIDYICKTTGVPRITYVGHSQGTTTMTVLLSEMPEYNNKMSGVVFLSTVCYSSNIESPLMRLLAEILNPVKTADAYEFAPHRPPFSTLTAICASSKPLSMLCQTLQFSAFGFDYEQTDYCQIPVQFRSLPGGCSMKQIKHYYQLVTNGHFCNYNYGKAGNREKYGCNSPPSYKLENISAKMTIFYSNNDWLSNFKKDVSQMIARLSTSPEVFEVQHKMWNHMDYMWGKDADSLVYYTVEKMLRKYNS